MNLEEKLKYAEYIIKKYDVVNDHFYKLYPFTTENLNGYMSKYDFNNKSVLTVGSSCDQIFNAHFKGASRIVCFDTNPLCEDYFNLKVAAFKALDLDEFIKFFCRYNDNSLFNYNRLAFNDKTFSKVIPYLSKDSYDFWVKLYDKYGGKRIRKELFINDEETPRVLSSFNSFMKEDDYYSFRDSLHLLHPSFIISDIRDVHKVLDEKFDYIMLSNIACFIQRMYDDNPLYSFRNTVLNLMEWLNCDGVLFLAYLYDMSKDTKFKSYWDVIYHLDKVFEVFRYENISDVSFVGLKGLNYNCDTITDMVLTLRK